MTQISRVVHGTTWGLRFTPDDPLGVLRNGLTALGYSDDTARSIIERGTLDYPRLLRALTVEAVDTDLAYVPSEKGHAHTVWGARATSVSSWLPQPGEHPTFGVGIVPNVCDFHDVWIDGDVCEACANDDSDGENENDE